MKQQLEKIKFLAKQVPEKNKLVKSRLDELEDELKITLDSVSSIYASSNSIKIESLDDDEWIYGYLHFNSEGLKILYRSTDDDYSDFLNGIPSEHKSYRSKSISDAKTSWKIIFTRREIVQSLFDNVEKYLSDNLSEAHESFVTLDEIIYSENYAAEKYLQEALADNESLSRSWAKARSLVFTDPSDSITRSSSYLESVCRYIIENSGNELPKKKDITSLAKNAIKYIYIDEYKEAGADINQLIGGVKSIISGAGSVRTHIGTAHGSSLGDSEASAELALLVSNACVTASLFLLRTYEKSNNNV